MTSVDHLADEVLSALVDEELLPAELQAARAHIETCGYCAAQFAALRTVHDLLHRLPEVDPPRDFSLGPRLVADPPNVIRLQHWYTATRAAAASLAAVFVLLVAGTLYVDTAAAPARQRTVFEVSTSQNTAPAASGGAAANAPAPAPGAALAPAAGPTTAPAAAAKAAPAAAVARDAGAPPPAAPAAGAPAPAQADAQSRAVTLSRTPETTTDLTAAATRVQPLPTRPPVAEPVGAPAPAVVAQAAGPAALDPAAPLRTAAVAVGLLAALILLCALIVRHRLGRARAPLSIQE